MFLLRYFGHAADLAIGKPHFNPTRMKGRRSKKILYRTVGDLTAALVFLQYDTDFQSGINIFSVLSFHLVVCCGDKDNARLLSSKA